MRNTKEKNKKQNNNKEERRAHYQRIKARRSEQQIKEGEKNGKGDNERGLLLKVIKKKGGVGDRSEEGG